MGGQEKVSTNPFILSKQTKSPWLGRKVEPTSKGNLKSSLSDGIEGSIGGKLGFQILNLQLKPPKYRHGPK